MVSNKTLALFIVAAVVVSLAGTFLSLKELDQLQELPPIQKLTGRATGEVELEISSNAACNVDSNVSFGSAGQPTGQITLSSEKDNSGLGVSTGAFNDCTSGTDCLGVQINNTGNVHLYINYSSDVNATTMLGGPNVNNTCYQYYVKNGTDGDAQPGCRGITNAGWANISTDNIQICTNLTYTDSADMMTMEFNVTIDDETPTGTKTSVITIDCIEAT